jgi:hypothetical protein
MVHIIYMSSAVVPFSPAELQSLLGTSRRNNAALGITGILLYKDGNFLQVLEGEKTAVDQLYAKIALDRRHHGVMTFFREEITEREFPGWSMAFRDLSAEAENSPEGFNNLLNASWSDLSPYPDKVRAFMKMFVRQKE